LDNIRSIFNVGAIFRIADGVGLSQMHLCGITATPEHPKVVKTALGAEQSVPWQYHPNALDAAQALRAAGYQLWAIEGHPRAQPLSAVQAAPAEPIALLAGNEKAGVDPALLSLCDRILHIPMQGRKRSLNVAVAFGIAAYWITMRHT
jgi:tRNA G18 (ribose-2'-O)-methylase SpoU